MKIKVPAYGLLAFFIVTQGLLAQSGSNVTIESASNDTASFYLLERSSQLLGMGLQYDAINNNLEVISFPFAQDPFTALAIQRSTGWVEIGNGKPAKKLSLGSDLARVKLALWESNDNTKFYGLGVTNNSFNLTVANENGNFIFWNHDDENISEEVMRIEGTGLIGIGDTNPAHQLSLGNGLARTKLALYEDANNSTSYGMGVQAGQFNFNLGNSNAEYAFYDSPGLSAQKIFEIEGNGQVFAYEIRDIGDNKNMQYNTITGEIGYDNSSRRYKSNITTLEDDWDKILSTRPVKYTRPASPNHWEFGYIAEEMDSIGLTNLVGYDVDGIPDDVKYDRIVLYLTEIVKEQQASIADLKTKAETHRAELASVHRIIGALGINEIPTISTEKTERATVQEKE